MQNFVNNSPSSITVKSFLIMALTSLNASRIESCHFWGQSCHPRNQPQYVRHTQNTQSIQTD